MSRQEAYLNVLSTFAYHCGAIMSAHMLGGFGLHVPPDDGAPEILVEIIVEMRVVARGRNGDRVWDQVEVNGQVVGNRCAAREAYARLCAPVIAAAAKAAGL